MVHGFYFRFYKILHNDFLSSLFAKIMYALYCCLFIFKKIKRYKTATEMSVEKAHNIINKTYPRPVCTPIYENKTIDNNIDLSVIIPVYNHKDTIKENIDSVLNQKTKYKFEVLLVDDGSTDGVSDVIKVYDTDPRVTIITQKNGGIGSARNMGINNAVGKYIMFVDCDDIVNDDIVENLMSNAYSQNYDMVMAAHNLVKVQNGKIVNVIPNIYSKHNLMKFKNGDKIMNLAGLPWCKVYKKVLWNEVRFFPGYWYEDTIILPLIFTQVKTYKYITNIEYEYKWFENNFSHTQCGEVVHSKFIERYWLYVEIIERYEKMGMPFDEKFYTLLLRHMSSYYYPTIKNMDNEIVTAMFVIARELVEKYKPKEKIKLPYVLKNVERAFEENDIELWKLASCYQ